MDLENHPLTIDQCLEESRIISNVLINIKQYIGETFVVLINDKLIDNDLLLRSFAQDISMLKQAGINTIIVHGGESIMAQTLEKLGVDKKKANQIKEQSNINKMAEMILDSRLNSDIVSAINKTGSNAIGVSGRDANFIRAKKSRKSLRTERSIDNDRIIEIGFVGRPEYINPEILISFEEADLIPVISPVGTTELGENQILNPIKLAGFIAQNLAVNKLLIFMDELLPQKKGYFPASEIHKIVAGKNRAMKEVLEEGKLSLEAGVDGFHLLDYNIPHSLLLSIFSDSNIGINVHQDFLT